MTPELSSILKRLRKVRRYPGNRWNACCPAHADRNPSMMVKLAADGQIFFHCSAGCDPASIRAALGMGRRGGRTVKPVAFNWDERTPPRRQPRYNFAHLASMFQCGHAKASELASPLGVSAAALMDFRLGWCDGYKMWSERSKREVPVRCWTWPMYDATVNATGLRTRYADGHKGTWTDSAAGVFVPLRWLNAGPLVVCEGPTDAAAVWDWGFDVIGKPSCSGGDEIVEGILKRTRRDVVILSNLDPPIALKDAQGELTGKILRPGQDGAIKLANRILWRCASLRVITPPGFKDARLWKNGGGTRRDVEEVIASKRQWSNAKRRAG